MEQPNTNSKNDNFFIDDLEVIYDIGNFISYYGTTAINDLIAQAPHNRHSSFFQAIANNCKKFLKSYENGNFDFDSNGEKFVLHTLANIWMQNQEISIFDVGANQGDWSLIVNQIMKNAKIHSFEIANDTFIKLKHNTQEYKNIYANNFGLLNKTGRTEIIYYPNNDHLSSVYDYPHALDKSKIVANVMKGDDYILQNKIDHIHFLKIDVEGAENLVLEGFTEFFNQGKIDVVQFEYGQVNILSRYLLIDFYHFFVQRDYLVGKIYPNYVDFKNYSLEDENFMGPNYLAVKREKQGYICALSYQS